MTFIFIIILTSMNRLIDIDTIKSDWPKYRCRPDVMIMAGIYGHDAAENINFCLNNGFQERAKSAMGPFYSFLEMFVNILMTLLKSINSIRMIFATIVGSVTQILKEFTTRIKALFSRIQMTAFRIKWLMQRIFATMNSLIFMTMSGLQAVNNFGNTFLFKFLDTFCFDPDTPIETLQGTKPIKDVQIRDVLKDGSRVTATFQFAADGQEMVSLPGNILVSTNHYLLHEGKWIHSADHPLAQPAAPWSGGTKRPLICLNTDTHTFQIGSFTFRDYDETEEGDYETMCTVLEQLNGKPCKTNVKEYSCCVDGSTCIKTSSGFVKASELSLGTKLPQGEIAGIVKKQISSKCLVDGVAFAPGTAIWSEEHGCWKRAGDLQPGIGCQPEIFYSFVVTPSACLETESGLIFRDYVEIHSPDTEAAYSAALLAKVN